MRMVRAVCGERSAYFDGSEVGQDVDELSRVELRRPLMSSVFVETELELVTGTTGRRIVLCEDRSAHWSSFSFQDDVVDRRSHVVVVVVEVEAERQQRVVAQSLVAQKLSCNDMQPQ